MSKPFLARRISSALTESALCTTFAASLRHNVTAEWRRRRYGCPPFRPLQYSELTSPAQVQDKLGHRRRHRERTLAGRGTDTSSPCAHCISLVISGLSKNTVPRLIMVRSAFYFLAPLVASKMLLLAGFVPHPLGMPYKRSAARQVIGGVLLSLTARKVRDEPRLWGSRSFLHGVHNGKLTRTLGSRCVMLIGSLHSCLKKTFGVSGSVCHMQRITPIQYSASGPRPAVLRTAHSIDPPLLLNSQRSADGCRRGLETAAANLPGRAAAPTCPEPCGHNARSLLGTDGRSALRCVVADNAGHGTPAVVGPATPRSTRRLVETQDGTSPRII